MDDANLQTTPIIEGKDLKKSFFLPGREIVVFEHISFSFQRGKVTLVSGRSGVGKSTLLSLLGGLDRQTAGSIIFDGKILETLSNSDLAVLRREKIGIIFQNFNLLPSWTAAENVEAVLMHSGLDRRERRARVEKILEEFGLADRLGNLPSELSVGQQQRVAIARALINNPMVILADEPTGDVDFETAQEIIAKLISAVRERQASLIVVTHGGFPEKFADEIFCMKDGKMEKR